MPSSRRGQQIARKACDGCRDRKIKCTWTDGDAATTPCDGCVTVGIYCTFQTTRKRRGRPQRDLEKFRQIATSPNGLTSPDLHVQPLSLVAPHVAIEHLFPLSIFHQIIEDFLEDLYPIAPLIHIPSFSSQLQECLFLTDPTFLRLCLSLCAMTIASLPRKASIYRFEYYTSAKDMVSRACQLVTASRLATSPDWADDPSSNDLICSLFLGMASHYTQCPRMGWALINESIHCSRSLALHRQDGYTDLNAVETEINKRAFWMIYIVQIHDRMSHAVPYTLLGESPSSTDWEFLLPVSISDEELSPTANTYIDQTKTPVIAGFVTLVKVFLCMRDLLSAHLANPFDPRAAHHNQFLSPTSLLSTFSALSSVLDDIPSELNIVETQTQPDQQARTTNHFNIMKSNIYITKLYLQCWILDRYLSLLPPIVLPQSPSSTLSEAQRLRSYRQDITRQALQVLNFCSQSTLESHGESMVVKIREIATSLLEQEQEQYGTRIEKLSEERSDELRSKISSEDTASGQDYVMASFLHILAVLDYAHRHAVDTA